MSLVEFARDELTRAGMFDKDSDYGGMLGDAVMKMVAQFAEEGHSGMSASMAIALFKRVANYEPLTALTGADDEWIEYATGMWQNKRCSHVFKDSTNGPAYDYEGIIFEDSDGSRWTNIESRAPVTFPYTPATRVVKRNANGGPA